MGRRPKVTEALHEIGNTIAKKAKVKEKRYYDIIGKAEAEKQGSENYMYVRSGVALIGSVYPLMMADYPTPKILYQEPQVISKEDVQNKIAANKAKIHKHMYLDKDLVIKFGIWENYNGLVNMQGPGINIKDSVVYTFYSKITPNKYSKLWKATQEEMPHVSYYLYEIWTRKCICDIQAMIENMMLKEQIEAKLKYFRENNYSEDSIMYKYIQIDINETLERKNEEWDVLIKKYGEIATKDNLKWLNDKKMCGEFDKKINMISDNMEKNGIATTTEEEWIDQFERIDVTNTLELPQKMIDLFDEFYKNYKEI